MTWYHYLLGFLVTAAWLALILLLLACGLWLQGWLAGRRYYNRARPDPWGRSAGRPTYTFLESATGEDRMALVHPDTDLRHEMPDGSVIAMSSGRMIDGQSIPVLARPLIGGPFDGRSRNAAALHDELCAVRQRSAIEAHGAMYAAMRARGLWWRGPIVHAVQLNWGARWTMEEQSS